MAGIGNFSNVGRNFLPTNHNQGAHQNHKAEKIAFAKIVAGFDGTIEKTSTKTEEGFSKTLAVTNAEGETLTRTMNTSRDEDGITRTVDLETSTSIEGHKSLVVSHDEEGKRTVTRETSFIKPDDNPVEDEDSAENSEAIMPDIEMSNDIDLLLEEESEHSA